MQAIISRIFHGLKSDGFVQMVLPDLTSLALKPAVKSSSSKLKVLLSDVPTLTCSPVNLLRGHWDLISVRVIKLINGLRTVKEIITVTSAEEALVLSCLKNLLYSKLIAMLPSFRFSDLYILTSLFNSFLSDQNLQQKCFDAVRVNYNHSVTIEHVSKVFSLLSNHIPLKKIAHEFADILDLRRLVQFGVRHGILSKIHKYPCLVNKL